MNAYFSLQYKRTNRKLDELGIHPAVGYIVGFAAFILLSEYLYQKTEFARYALLLMALSLLVSRSEINRVEFLRMVFGNKKSRIIRMVENGIISLPFCFSLLYHRAFLEAVFLILGSIFLASFSFRSGFNYVLPTPFYKKPFEFTVGFRKTVYIFPFIYLLTFIALSVDNLNLALFAMLLVFVVSLTYYAKPENEYFVWSYAVSPSRFLWDKLMTATGYSLLLAAPIAAMLAFFYPGEMVLIVALMLVGLAFLWVIILGKYSTYPNEMNLPEGILMAMCIYFPPLLLVLMPYFYSKSIKRLNAILK